MSFDAGDAVNLKLGLERERDNTPDGGEEVHGVSIPESPCQGKG